MQLEPCAQCKRHVAVGAAACPFCAAPIVRAAPRPALVGRWSRAAIFAGATTLTGCHTGPTNTTNTNQIQNDTKQQQTPVEVSPPQVGTGTIHGVLRDQNGALLPNMPILLGEGARSTRTDARGEFVFADLPPGGYQVVFEIPNNPHQGPNATYVEVKADAIVQADGTIYPQPVDRGPCCKPYGAPPARRRIV